MRAEYVIRGRTSQAPSFTPFYHNVSILSVLATEGQKGDPFAMALLDQGQRISAVLGPTNTGKTYLAIERMLGHRSGMMGFPLRLLARENYDRVVCAVGARHVALVTGEEKIIPPTARYFLCTVESMPVDRLVEFLAIDEIQLCADRERGYMFTDRLLHARGMSETMFLGADSMRSIIRKLVPEAEFIARPRFSKLSYAGQKKLSRIQRRSAVVAFTANDVYAIAEQIRRHRGGAAIVLGALSPRTRNAQVAMYQAGEVDYLVATDAIGMGLNMDISHVAFWRHIKFDGYRNRNLTVQEIAQIAGRAGRHMSDGTFGTLAEQSAFPPEVVDAIEEHRFDRVRSVWWRSADLEFKSLKTLLKCLDAPPPNPVLMRTHGALDHDALKRLSGNEAIADLAQNPDTVRLLWEVCQIPDFRKTMPEVHVRLLARIYRHLCADDGNLPTDWVAAQLTQLERTDGDIDTLMARIAHTRTWTYISHRADWLEDSVHWQDRARAIEDQLSDALHERLTQRFVDRRNAALVKSRGKENLIVDIDQDKTVFVEGEHVGHLDGLSFVADSDGPGETRRLIAAAAKRALVGEIRRRVEALENDPDDAFEVSEDGAIRWHGSPVARITRGGDVLSPHLDVPANDILPVALRQRLAARLRKLLETMIASIMVPLVRLDQAGLQGAARGVAFQLREGLGSVLRASAQQQIAALSAGDRKALRANGVRIGVETVFIPALLKPKALRLRALLWNAFNQISDCMPPAPGRVSATRDQKTPDEFYAAIGYRVVGDHVVRIDIVDRAALSLIRLFRKGPFDLPRDFAAMLGMGNDQAEMVAAALGFERSGDDDLFVRVHRRHGAGPEGKRGSQNSVSKNINSGSKNRVPVSPFARLADLRPQS
jgi:ATP-dependent RNA helicase SUPV3L1/SUV3